MSLAILGALVALFVGPALAEPAKSVPVRSSPMDKVAPYRRFLWVTRWDFRSAEDVEKICYNAASARFTDIFFQVRGAGSVCFKSPYEPWAWELSSTTPGVGLGVTPCWDPLATMIKEAKRRGLRVHAWINAMPAWNLNSPPKVASQLYASHPGWLMVDAAGRAMTPNGFYAFLDPGLPEVREYLARLLGRMAQDYEVDGVHLDYIRYPTPGEVGREFSFHPKVVASFRKQFGAAPKEAPDRWQAYRREQVSATIKGIRDAVKAARPGIELSATCMADPKRGREEAGQDPKVWVDQGIVDAVVPMAYVRNDLKRFAEVTEPFLIPSRRSRLWVGIWPRNENEGYAEQIKLARAERAAGVAVFAYGELFPQHRQTWRATKIYRTFAGITAPPPSPNSKIASASSAKKSASAKKPSSKAVASKASASSSKKTAKSVASAKAPATSKAASSSKAKDAAATATPKPSKTVALNDQPAKPAAKESAAPPKAAPAKKAKEGTKSKRK